MTSTTGKRKGNEPYCGHCGYALTGLTESSKCPECGKPLVEVLRRPSFAPTGKRYRSRATLFGLPVIDIAIGPHGEEKRGKARGVIAIGDLAVGGIAIGGLSTGVVAVGGVGVGLFSAGGLAVGLVSAVGGMAVGSLATGGGAIGVLANGGGAIGFAAQGGGAVGLHVRDGRTPINAPPIPTFEQFSWFFGAWPPRGGSVWQPMIVAGGVILMAAVLIGIVAMIRYWQEPD